MNGWSAPAEIPDEDYEPDPDLWRKSRQEEVEQ